MAALVQTLAVAEYLSFHRAARALGTSQSSVSARVKALEEDLGVLLFQRNTRGVRLTEAGCSFVAQVSGALESLDRAVKTAGRWRVASMARYASVSTVLSLADFSSDCLIAFAVFMPR
jgi:DNA-binding transcriptional LysR family regulator